MRKRLLCISYRFPPQTYALAIRVSYFLNHLRQREWDIDAVTAAPNAEPKQGLDIHHVPDWSPERPLQALRSLRLGKLVDLLVWPDPYIFWVLPAYRTARRLARRNQYDATAVFMMPHSTGLVGLLLQRETGLPLVLNMNDSLTCSDMNPEFPSRLHYMLARKLENQYVQSADASIYVSKRNMERVRARQPNEHRETLHLIRRGVKSPPAPRTAPHQKDGTFRIRYVGGTSGWYQFLEHDRPPSLSKRLYRAWKKLGTYSHANLDVRSHGPVYLGQAVKHVLTQHPEWRGNIHVDVYGKRYPEAVENTVLNKFGLQDIIHLHAPIPHDEALRHMVESDLLFMALPDRVDDSPGGRISAKTYEYLRTDRPILAALPPGENREYLRDKPGVHLTEPDGVDEMSRIISELAARTFDGVPIRVDRSELQSSLAGASRAQEFEDILSTITSP